LVDDPRTDSLEMNRCRISFYDELNEDLLREEKSEEAWALKKID